VIVDCLVMPKLAGKNESKRIKNKNSKIVRLRFFANTAQTYDFRVLKEYYFDAFALNKNLCV